MTVNNISLIALLLPYFKEETGKMDKIIGLSQVTDNFESKLNLNIYNNFHWKIHLQLMEIQSTIFIKRFNRT
jgi:hypothetical protein